MISHHVLLYGATLIIFLVTLIARNTTRNLCLVLDLFILGSHMEELMKIIAIVIIAF